MLVSLLFCIELYFGLFFCHAPASARRLIKNLLTYLLTYSLWIFIVLHFFVLYEYSLFLMNIHCSLWIFKFLINIIFVVLNESNIHYSLWIFIVLYFFVLYEYSLFLTLNIHCSLWIFIVLYEYWSYVSTWVLDDRHVLLPSFDVCRFLFKSINIY